MRKLLANYLLLCILLHVFNKTEATSQSSEENESNYEEDIFVPSTEWQVVKKGQKIPKGLHVRVNLETGITEAKLMDENENEGKGALLEIPNISDDSNFNAEKDSEDTLKTERFLPPSEVKEALKKLKSDDEYSKYKKDVKNKFRSYEELKQDLSDLNLAPKSDAEILKDLIEKYDKVMESKDGEFRKETETLRILEDVEYLVHQYDNANEFIAQNGFNKIVYKNLNSSNSEIKRETLKLMGSSIQNNAKIQIHALETGSLHALLRILALDTDYGVKNRAVFALSALLRRFPLAQLKFIENAGLSVFSNLFKKSENLKIQLKVATLVNDLITEHNEAFLDTNVLHYEEKRKQYMSIDIKSKLYQHSWCDNLSQLLINTADVDPFDHDAIEKCLIAISSLMDTCSTDFSLKIVDTLELLNKQYKQLSKLEKASDDSASGYYTKLHDMCGDILKVLLKNFKSEL